MDPIFDAAVYDAFKDDLGEEDTREALAAFLDDTAQKMARLRARSDDRALVRLEAHSIKSSAALFGFMRLSRLARELEPQAAGLEAAQLAQSLEGLSAAFAATREFARASLLAGAAA